jgi:serine/threonine protein kinase
LKKLNHPKILQYLGNFEENGNDYSIFKFFSDKNLFNILSINCEQNLRIKEDFLWHIFLQCLEGLTYLHNQGIIHRNIKPANIFIDDKNNIQIVDFEIAVVVGENQVKHFTDDPQMQKALLLNFGEIRGAENYIAPEVENGQHYDQRVDVYSLGISFYCLCYYNLPYINGNNMHELMNDNFYSSELRNIISKMIQKDQKNRPTSNEIYTEAKKLYILKYGNNS